MITYLAGPINGCTDAEAKDWRSLAKSILGEANCLDPMRRDYRGREAESVNEIVESDKSDILNSDVLLAYCPQPSVGTSMEIHFAWQCATRGTRVVLVIPEGVTVSPWYRYHADEVYPTVREACEAIAAG